MSLRYKGAVISATPPTTTGGESGVASGSWTLEQQFQAQGAGNWPTPPQPKYIEDVFSTYLYTGNGTSQSIVNGINLSGNGGMVWTKSRTGTYWHEQTDTVRGPSVYLSSNSTNAQNSSQPQHVTAFNSNGFSVGNETDVNASGVPFASWTFQEQPKFFDVVTYTGDGASTRYIPHNLTSVPGCVIIKRTDTTSDWKVGIAGYALQLNTTDGSGATTLTNGYVSTADFTSTDFVVKAFSGVSAVNANGGTYVAYVFAHNAGGFGLTGTDNVISCGSYTGTGTTSGPTINLGYEPQWVLIKRASGGAGDWIILDTMRGITKDTWYTSKYLYPNLSSSEVTTDGINILSTGFQITNSNSYINGGGSDYIYIAIRRGPMKVPTSGTSVFAPVTTASTAQFAVGFPADLGMLNIRGGSASFNTTVGDRLRGGALKLLTSSTAAESTGYFDFTLQNDFKQSITGADAINYLFRRAPSFFDEVCYTGNGSTQTIAHNLGVVPELIIAKNRGQAGNNWPVLFNFASTTMNYGFLNLTNSCPNDTYANVGVFSAAPTSTSMFLTNSSSMNASGYGIVAYLFATCAGVSKVGSYTGTATTLQVDCGFTGGARFVLIKRTDSTGDWYVWDSARGIVSGNDPYLLLNSTAAEVTSTDYVDTYNAGFEISSTAPDAINASGGTFIFLAIA